MKKLLLVFTLFLLFGSASNLNAQCYGTVNLDQSVSGNGISSFDISTTFGNELILVSADGWPGPFSGSVTVDGNPATFVNSAINGNSGETSVWCYAAANAGLHAVAITETGYSTSYDFDINFATSYYANNTCMPLSLSNVSSSANTVGCNTYGPITGSITTTEPSSVIYCSAEINDVNSSSFAFSYTGANFLNDSHRGSGIEGSDAYESATSAGTYNITATTASPNSGCEGGLTMVLVAIQPPLCGVNVTLTPTNPTCSNNNGSITATVTGGSSPYTYAWTPSGGSNATASGLSAGTYTVTVTDHSGCTGTASTTLTLTNTLTASGTVNANDKCFGNNNGSATVTPGGGASPYTYSWNPGGQTTATVSTLSAGTYTVTVTDNSGCSTTTSVTISQPSSAVGITIASQTNVTCNAGSNGSATANAATGGTSPYTYNWTPTGGTNLTASNLSAGTYTITATDNHGCAATASVTISQPATGVGVTIASQTNVLCNGGATGSATANPATGGTSPYTYNWTPTGGTNLTASNLSAGTYTITATDNHGCAATASVTISQPATGLGITIASQTNVLCNGGNTGSATANTATGGTSPYTYNWTPTGGTNLTASNLSAGTYTITATDNGGCTATASVTISQPVNALGITIASQTNIQCFGGTGSAIANAATGGTSPYTYNWTPSGGTNLAASNLSAGSYTITATDNNGCTATASVTITQPAASVAITIASHTNVSCSGGSNGTATANAATGGSSPYTYNWTPSGGTNLTASNLSAGTYTITATDNNGCSATASVTISQPASSISISIASQTNVTCNGNSDGSATANAATGGTSPYTYNWTPSGGTGLTASNLSAGTYTITATDNNGCTGTASVTISQPASNLAITIASQTNIQCFGGTGSAIANAATGGTFPYTYNWTPSGGTNLTASNLSAGTYTITATDNNGCSATASVNITQPAASVTITIASQTNILCFGGSGSATANPATGGTSPYTYNWTPSGGTNLTASNLSAGSYTITATDNNGCGATASVTITQPAAGVAITIASQTNVKCFGGTGSATANAATGGIAPYTYNWTPSGGTNLTASNLSAGSYTITAMDNNGCSATASVIITQPASAVSVSIASQKNVLCISNSGSATANAASGGTGPYTYSWSPNGGTNLTASGLTAGSYTITATDNNGCTATASVTISQAAATLNISIASKTTLPCEGIGYIVAHAATGGTPPYTYNWTPSGGTNLATITTLSAGTYTITASDSNGCTATASETINVPSAMSASANVTGAVNCYGSNTGSAMVTATGGTMPYTYSWFPSSGTNAAESGLSAGTYTITITDSNGCHLDVNVTLTQPAGMVITTDSMNVTINNGTGCNGEAAVTVVSGGIAPYTYLWSPGGETTDTIKQECGGDYCCTVTDSRGCSQTTCVIILNTVGVPTISGNSSTINIYPDPSNGQFTISGLEKGWVISMYDYTGRTLNNSIASDKTIPVNISNQPDGIYLIRIVDKDGNLVGQKKVVKTN